MHLTDSALLKSVDANLSKLGFDVDPDLSKRFGDGIKKILGSPGFGTPTFSLFTYSSYAENHPNECPSLRDIWRDAIQGAVWVLKHADRRENPKQSKGYHPSPH